jgi:hypothetical protein
MRRAVGLTVCLLVVGGCTPLWSQVDQFDIGSAGTPTITGNSGGSITATPVDTAMVVTVNFGELSPLNGNGLVRVVIPILLRTTAPFEVTATAGPASSGDPNAVRPTDIGFGIQNVRRLPAGRTAACMTVVAPFGNDPSMNRTLDPATGRTVYQSSLAQAGTPAVLLRGSRLSTGNIDRRKRDQNGWAFDVIITVVPQFYSSGSFNLVLTFNVGPGPSPC